MLKKLVIATTVVASVMANTAIAQDKSNPAIKARQAQMQLYSFNLGQLAAMAKGNVDYNADAAMAAANNLVALSQMNQSAMWPQGTDNASDSSTRALPAIWENFPDVFAKGQAFADAAVAMQAAAGVDLASLQGAMGALGGSCSGCHKPYRGPRN